MTESDMRAEIPLANFHMIHMIVLLLSLPFCVL
jgi:hypothetical protein